MVLKYSKPVWEKKRSNVKFVDCLMFITWNFILKLLALPINRNNNSLNFEVSLFMCLNSEEHMSFGSWKISKNKSHPRRERCNSGRLNTLCASRAAGWGGLWRGGSRGRKVRWGFRQAGKTCLAQETRSRWEKKYCPACIFWKVTCTTAEVGRISKE